jgi:hypothetical protein
MKSIGTAITVWYVVNGYGMRWETVKMRCKGKSNDIYRRMVKIGNGIEKENFFFI